MYTHKQNSHTYTPAYTPDVPVYLRCTFGVDPDTHIDAIQAAEKVILAGDWSAKIEITGMSMKTSYLLTIVQFFR